MYVLPILLVTKKNTFLEDRKPSQAISIPLSEYLNSRTGSDRKDKSLSSPGNKPLVNQRVIK